MSLLNDPMVLTCSLIAVILVGLSRGGFGGAMGILGVPVMALALPPVQAAAILLPILILVDIVGLWSWRKEYDITTLKIMLPAAVVGLVFGGLAAVYVSDDIVRFIVGLMCIIFVLDYIRKNIGKRAGSIIAAPHNKTMGRIWGALSGFTSFISHIGAPPFQVYTLPLRLSPTVLAGTTIRFFFIVNILKLLPYFALGQFDATNLQTSFLLMPIAPIATFCGVWLVKRMRIETFYPLMYVLMFFAGLKLIFDIYSYA
jgi:uncharacterized membrane protein YfcA